MYYRFSDGVFIEADTFESAQVKYIKNILAEKEDKDCWHKCTCLGFNHRFDCPEKSDEVPF